MHHLQCINLTFVATFMIVDLIFGLVTLPAEGALEGSGSGVGHAPVLAEMGRTQVCLPAVNAHVWSYA